MKSKGKSKSTPKNNEPHHSGVLLSRGMERHLAEASWRVALSFILLGLPASFLDKTLSGNGKILFLSMIFSSFVSLTIVYRYSQQYFPESFNKNRTKK
ncbi:hypothetical protein DYH10_03025 [Candidatus Saccharibacteria bacterium CPR2]|nr:hypothetical protein [Candidatus Saccharibacteria bacterium CPR2]